jgi:hypothetical protein
MVRIAVYMVGYGLVSVIDDTFSCEFSEIEEEVAEKYKNTDRKRYSIRAVAWLD